MAIKILPPRLANQIAAGEVVERPASVIKELVENSLDAGATRIDIDIERGGSQLIRIRDNGSGIAKEELELALSRHATSKIHHLDDLEAIMSLGFRGEALASISSVSRLTLTSRTQEQSEAWLAYAQGRDMAVTIAPAAHPQGTTVEVADLFFNTPARRKFLRTEKTEFSHIDEVLKRIALSRFDVSMTLRHNGKQVRQYRAAISEAQIEKRVASICGQAFMQHAIRVSLVHDGLSLSGWITTPQGAHKQNDLQYCYVNGRMMRDKLINHAIRQGYESSLPLDHYATYVLFIELDPKQVDVNVHPAKHEVRFHQARLVHDFIYQGVYGALSQVMDIVSPAPAASAWHQQDDPQLQSKIPQTVALQSNPTISDKVADSDAPTYQTQSSYQNPLRNSSSANSTSRNKAESRTAQVGKEYNDLYQALFNTKPVLADEAQQEQKQGAEGHNGLKDYLLNEHLSKDNLPKDDAVEKDTRQQEIIKQNKEPSHQAFAINDVLKNAKALAIIERSYALIESQGQFFILDIQEATRQKLRYQLQPKSHNALISQPLLIPLAIPCDANILKNLANLQPALIQLGIAVDVKSKTQLAISGVPAPMRQHNLQQLIPQLLQIMAESKIDKSDLSLVIDWLSEALMPIDASYKLADVASLLQTWEHILAEQFSDDSLGASADLDTQIKMPWLRAIDFTPLLAEFYYE